MEEAKLVQKMKKGDKEAFGKIYEIYKEKIYRTACLISSNRTDAEDITQETFIKAYLHCKELKDETLFKYWLFKILNRTAWQMMKKQKREEPDDEIFDRLGSEVICSPVNNIIQKQEQEMLINTIKSLNYNQRITVILYYYNEMSVKEIAKTLGCMEGTVKSRLFAARKKMQSILSKEKLEGLYHEAV